MHLSQLLYNFFCLSYRARKWYLRHIYSHITPEIVQMKMEDGSLLYVKPRFDYVQREIYLHQGKYTYESHVVRWVTRNLHQGDIVVDVGSHIGYYLGPVCRGTGPNGRAFFAEPLPDHHALLRKNISTNHFTCAVPIDLAISAQTGEVVFYLAKDSGRNSLVKNKITDDGIITVQATTLDLLFDKYSLGQIDLLLVDVEGAEVLVFQGASTCFKGRKIQTILCEWHPKQIENEFQTNPTDLLTEIIRVGYSVFQLDITTGQELPFNTEFIHTYQHLVLRLR